MASILLAVKSEYVKRIFSGEKTFEYRKRIPKQSVERIIIYETSPCERIVGIVNVEGVMKDTPTCLWNKTFSQGGISQEAYMDYYAGSDVAYAFVLGEVRRFSKDIKLCEIGVLHPPQSFQYIDEKRMKAIERLI